MLGRLRAKYIPRPATTGLTGRCSGQPDRLYWYCSARPAGRRPRERLSA